MATNQKGNQKLPTWPQIVEWLKKQWQTASQNWGSNVPGAATGGDVIAGVNKANELGLIPTAQPNLRTSGTGVVSRGTAVENLANMISGTRRSNPNVTAVRNAQPSGTVMPFDVDKGGVPLPLPNSKITQAQQATEIRRRNRARRAGM